MKKRCWIVPLISLIIPTRNEEETIGECIHHARAVFEDMGVEGEIIVADSSTDATPEIARSLGARLVRPDNLGYGNAYLEGFKHARGRYIVILDGDLTYDPCDMPKFVGLLEKGKADLVMCTRLKGEIKKGAMPPLHKHIGNPLLTSILNRLFGTDVSDVHCGMRAITKEALGLLNLHAGGMEFASEMLIEASRKNLRIAEVPITYYPRKGASKLSSFSDGWRHLRFMMLYRPTPFLLAPGLVALVLGLALTLFVLMGAQTQEIRMHSLILGSLLLIMGYQTFLSGVYVSAFGASYGISEKKGLVGRLMSYHSLERELVAGVLLLAAGMAVGMSVILSWKATGYGSLQEVQKAMMSLILSILGIQTIFSATFISLLLLRNGTEPNEDNIRDPRADINRQK